MNIALHNLLQTQRSVFVIIFTLRSEDILSTSLSSRDSSLGNSFLSCWSHLEEKLSGRPILVGRECAQKIDKSKLPTATVLPFHFFGAHICVFQLIEVSCKHGHLQDYWILLFLARYKTVSLSQLWSNMNCWRRTVGWTATLLFSFSCVIRLYKNIGRKNNHISSDKDSLY